MAGSFDNATVLVTGATGFLGGHIVARLRELATDIHAVSRGARSDSEGLRWRRADLLDPDDCARLIAEVRPTHVIHAAWMATPGLFWTSPENESWLRAGHSLLEAFGRSGGKRFVGVGTCAEYDWSQSRFIEDETPLKPSTLYGKTKLAMSEAVAEAAARHGFSWGWGRVFLPYGPGDAAERLIPSVLAGLARREPVNLSAGTQERDFIFAPDAAHLLCRILESPENGAFNVGTGSGVSVRSAVERIAAMAGGADLLRFGAFPQRAGEPERLVASPLKVRKSLNWTPPHRLEAGLLKTLSAFSESVAEAK